MKKLTLFQLLRSRLIVWLAGDMMVVLNVALKLYNHVYLDKNDNITYCFVQMGSPGGLFRRIVVKNDWTEDYCIGILPLEGKEC